VTPSYPQWCYFPRNTATPDWGRSLIDAVSKARPTIDSAEISGLRSDAVLKALAPGLAKRGYKVETGKKRSEQIRRPVLFGDEGLERVAFHVDAFHPELGVVVEIEAGRGARGNAVYRDLIRTSLILDAQFLVLGVMAEYRHQLKGGKASVPSYADTHALLDAIYESGRLRLPFKGLLLFGY
jgi:hypothetical protein